MGGRFEEEGSRDAPAHLQLSAARLRCRRIRVPVEFVLNVDADDVLEVFSAVKLSDDERRAIFADELSASLHLQSGQRSDEFRLAGIKRQQLEPDKRQSQSRDAGSSVGRILGGCQSS